MAEKKPAIYIHIPFCESKCAYCDFYSLPVEGQKVAEFITAALTELERYHIKTVKSVYVGGGSPSCLPDEELFRLIQAVIDKVGKVSEFTIEINPGQVRLDALRKCREVGVNRISIGGQSFRQQELEFLGRRHDVDQIYKCVKMVKEAGFTNISLDLIFAIPGSSVASWRASLESALALEVQHISAYSLMYEPGTPLHRRRENGEVAAVSEEADREMYELAIDLLTGAGFAHYEISNFARPSSACAHNLVYWENEPYIGIGPGAASYWQGQRKTNRADVNAYIEAMKNDQPVETDIEIPDRIQIACETAVLNLRKTTGINLKKYQEKTGFDALALFAEPIAKFKKMNLLARTAEHLHLTREALPIADTVLCEFSTL